MSITLVARVCAWCKTKMGMVRWEGETHSATVTHGICGPCARALSTMTDEPKFLLTVFRSDAPPLVGKYDGVGAMLRLSQSVELPNFAGFTMHEVAEGCPACEAPLTDHNGGDCPRKRPFGADFPEEAAR